MITGFIQSPCLTRAVIWRNDTMVDLGMLGGSQSQALAINNAGDVVGPSTDAANNRNDAFLGRGDRHLRRRPDRR